jgi:hypothetical protein
MVCGTNEAGLADFVLRKGGRTNARTQGLEEFASFLAEGNPEGEVPQTYEV